VGFSGLTRRNSALLNRLVRNALVATGQAGFAKAMTTVRGMAVTRAAATERECHVRIATYATKTIRLGSLRAFALMKNENGPLSA
jgi:hypothetical protein